MSEVKNATAESEMKEYTFFQNISAATKTLWVLIPLVLLIEVAMSLPLGIVSPDHPNHIVTYATGCGIASGSTWTSLSDEDVMCIMDSILSVIGDSFQGFINNYLATMLGHIFTVYALINAQDSSITSNFGLKEKLHFFAYVIIMLDVIVELFLLHSITLSDPTTMKFTEYILCDDTPVKEITEYKESLVKFALIVIWIRVCIALVVSVIYVIKSEVTHDEKETEDIEDASKKET